LAAIEALHIKQRADRFTAKHRESREAMWATNIAISHADTGLMTAEVVHAEHISPNFVRVTLGGEELHHWRSLGYDQWFRLALPASDETRFDMGGFLRYLTLPKSTRPVIRNLTVRNYSADRE